MKEFKEGDKTFDPFDGHGEVVRIDKQFTNPLLIQYKNSLTRWFTIDGRCNQNELAQSLFHADEIPDFYKPYAQDARIGKWGYFWDDNFKSTATYAKLHDIKEGKFEAMISAMPIFYNHFSLEIPDHCK